MKLISEEKRELFRDKKHNEYPISPNGLKYGDSCIDFAEKELINLAIDFAKWCGKRYFYNENSYVWVLGTEKYTTEALFEKFIEQRNDS